MPKKSKKKKKQQAAILKASVIETYIRQKYAIDDNGFWLWFFNNSSNGDINNLPLSDDNFHVKSEFIEYFSILKEEFAPDINEAGCLEIENDI